MRNNSKLKNVIIYCRESRDDGYANFDRIETQRDILVDYCKKNKLGNILDIIIDDNKTGTSFDRFDGIKERIVKGEIDILLMKDASRLGRNQLQSLLFIQFIEEHDVEIIFESEKYDEDIFPLQAWFNERRVKDDSGKIRRVLKKKMEDGSIVIKAPYGYIEKKKGVNELIVDPETSLIVKEIFDLFISGRGKFEIATIMNKKGYPTPSQLKESYIKQNYTKIWNGQHIARILDSIVYTGDMPYGMRRKKSYKSKKYENVPKEDWIIIPDHHEAIIGKDVFEQAQSRIKRIGKFPTRNPGENIFSSLLFCGRCGSRLYKKVRKNYSSWYNCRKNNIEGSIKNHIREDYGCNPHRITENKLIAYIQDYIDQFFYEPEFKDKILTALDNVEDEKKAVDKRIKVLENQIESAKSKASKVYDDILDGELPEFLFKEKINEINQKLERDTQEIAELQDHLKQLIEDENAKDYYASIIEQVKQNGINNQTLMLLFKKIILFDKGDISEDCKAEYDLSNEEYQYIFENGGILFIQNILYKAIITSSREADAV